MLRMLTNLKSNIWMLVINKHFQDFKIIPLATFVLQPTHVWHLVIK